VRTRDGRGAAAVDQPDVGEEGPGHGGIIAEPMIPPAPARPSAQASHWAITAQRSVPATSPMIQGST
jgi:hypothetical protein